ncbi:hypothetical protein ALE3EI_0649 [Constantimarinum furrinae]|uniref:DUF4271 domain-containing protein n=1 Tax=Constantimarinum furrinae TaxID=2562285 RepID=A0A7G8PSB0_9FLAO|nr:hypothetical protein ALE3EI_0649 [Constantimarinum furrinae]
MPCFFSIINSRTFTLNILVDYADRHLENIDWITLLLFGCLALFALAKYLYPKRFQEFIMLPLTNKYFLIQGRNNEINHPFNILLFASQVISISLFIYLAFTVYNPDLVQQNSWLYVQICTFYSVFVLVKFCIEKIVAHVFSIETLINSYLYQKLSCRNLLSMFFFIANLVLFYVTTPSEVYIVTLFVLLLLLNGIALFYSYKTNGNSILKNFFYFILYLCALEISPYIILYKLMV